MYDLKETPKSLRFKDKFHLIFRKKFFTKLKKKLMFNVSAFLPRNLRHHAGNS